MQVLRVEKEDETLQQYIFHTETEESQADLKAKVKAWLIANTSLTWEIFYDRVLTIDSNRITIDMT